MSFIVDHLPVATPLPPLSDQNISYSGFLNNICIFHTFYHSIVFTCFSSIINHIWPHTVERIKEKRGWVYRIIIYLYTVVCEMTSYIPKVSSIIWFWWCSHHSLRENINGVFMIQQHPTPNKQQTKTKKLIMIYSVLIDYYRVPRCVTTFPIKLKLKAVKPHLPYIKFSIFIQQ